MPRFLHYYSYNRISNELNRNDLNKETNENQTYIQMYLAVTHYVGSK